MPPVPALATTTRRSTERSRALEQLAVIEQEPGYRLVSCEVDSGLAQDVSHA